jgi:hypothetical protein
MSQSRDSEGILEEARDLLAAWRTGSARHEAVVRWADELVEEMPSPPEWLLDLSLYGPEKCTSRPSLDFIEGPVPSFIRALGIRASLLNMDDVAQVERFVEWASGACMGGDLELPEVQFGYQLDHLWGDCNRMDLAVEHVRAELPSLRRGFRPSSARLRRALSEPSKERPRLSIAVRFLTSDEGGRRSGVPSLSSGQYAPHVVVGDPSRKGELTADEVLSRHHMLGVSFVEGPTGAAPGETLHCVVELLYSGVDYSGLRASVGILVVEGRRIVATGNVEVGSGAG